MPNFTLVVAIDKYNLNRLKYSYLTWCNYKKEIRSCPLVIIYDSDQVNPKECTFLDERQDVKFCPWNDPNNIYNSQREKMLTSFIVIPPDVVETEWFLKLDTDTYATNDSPWIDEKWFDDVVIVSNPWGYTKPANAIDILDEWGDKIDPIKNYPRLNIHGDIGSKRVRHKRIASWVYFCKTNWAKGISNFVKIDGCYKLPIPSQDTYSFYCSKRMGKNIKRIRFKQMGWTHSNKLHKSLGRI
jgi:hypothetical protein